MRKTVLKVLLGIAACVLGFIVVVWLIWIPSAKEPGYVFVSAWGAPGSAPGQFNDPTGIAVTRTEVFVSDARNARIQVFDFDGRFKREFGTKGDAPSQLGRPMNLSIAGNELYVADYWNDRVQVFALDGTPRRVIGSPGSGNGEFNAPGGVAVARNGDLFVADFYNQRVQHLRADGSFVKQWGKTRETGVSAGQFIYPTDVALAGDGTLYVADGYADRVQVFSSAGPFLRKWGGPFAINIFGPFNSWFATVTGITVDHEGNVFVADFYNNRIQKFTADGQFVTAFGERGSELGQFNKAIAVAVASDGTVFTVDYGNNRIQKWQPTR
ncbi:MAG: NHL repeat-containing protein [Acidiferrobacterales bacterium]